MDLLMVGNITGHLISYADLYERILLHHRHNNYNLAY